MRDERVNTAQEEVAVLAEGFQRLLAAGQPLTAPELALYEHLQQTGQALADVMYDRTAISVTATLSPRPTLGSRLVRAIRRSVGEAGDRAAATWSVQRLPYLAERLSKQELRAAAAGALLLALRLEGPRQLAKPNRDWLALGERLLELLDTAQEQSLSLKLACWKYACLRKLLDDDDVQMLQSGLDLCDRLLRGGQASTALVLSQQIQVVCQRELGSHDSLTRRSARQLANALSVAGDSAAADRVRAAAQIGGEKSPAHKAICAQPDNDDVVSLMLTRIESLSDELPETLRQACILATRLYSDGKYNQASRLGFRVYEILMQRLGFEHPETLRFASNLACTLWAQGEYASARRLQEPVVAGLSRILGSEHPDTLSARTVLAVILRGQGDLSGAHTLHAAVLHTRQHLLGAEHPDTLISASNVATLLNDLGDFAGARRIEASALKTRQRVLGSEHPDTLRSESHLAQTLADQGDLAGARTILESVSRRIQHVLGAEHPFTLLEASNLAHLVRAQGENLYARNIEESVFKTRQRVLGSDHPETLTSASNLALALIDQGDLADGREILESVLSSRELLNGAEHASALISTNNLAQTLHRQGEVSRAGVIAASLLRTLCKVGQTNAISFVISANLPILCDPSAAWPDTALRQVAELLPDLSKVLTHRLELLPHESWDVQYAHYETFHRRWVAFALMHAPEQLIEALGGLHGVRSSSQIQEESGALHAVAADASNPASPAVWQYLLARASVNSLRERISDLFNLHGSAAPGLADFREQERAAALVREKAEAELTLVAPDMAAELGALAGLTEEVVLGSLGTNDAWLTIAPVESPVALLLRPGYPGKRVTLGTLPSLGIACDRYSRSVREGRQGNLRDTLSVIADVRLASSNIGAQDRFPAFGTQTLSTALVLESKNSMDLLTEARKLCGEAFWAPLAPHLEGVRRLHMVTAAGQHELLLEFAQPPALSALEVLRYNGFAAYQRSLLPDMCSDSAEPLPLMVVTDTAEETVSPIPFTRLDAVVPLRHGRAQRVSAQQLMQRLASSAEPLAVLISAHGDVAKPEAGQLGGGHVLLPDGVELDPKTLATLRGRISWLMWVSCWAARVVHGGLGEPYGAISTLQHKGLRGGIACLAPVADFYSPLLSAAVWHARLSGASTSAALARAKWRLTVGDWAGMEDDILALRQAYRGLMLELLAPLREQAAQPGWDAQQWYDDRLQRTIRGWPLDGPVLRALESLSAAQVLGADLAEHEALVDECLECLFMPARDRLEDRDERSLLVQQEVERLCAVMVAFGRG